MGAFQVARVSWHSPQLSWMQLELNLTVVNVFLLSDGDQWFRGPIMNLKLFCPGCGLGFVVMTARSDDGPVRASSLWVHMSRSVIVITALSGWVTDLIRKNLRMFWPPWESPVGAGAMCESQWRRSTISWFRVCKLMLAFGQSTSWGRMRHVLDESFSTRASSEPLRNKICF